MKILMMSPWNASSGASTHAELIGREWVKMGHELLVLSHDGSSRSEGSILQEDEDYIVRCWGTSYWGMRDWLNPAPLLDEDYDVFVAQNLEVLPMRDLLKVYDEVRNKAVTVLVIHEDKPPSEGLFYRFEWDSIVCFDERYKNTVCRGLPNDKITIIPFPCHPLKKGNKYESRIKLGLPLDKKIIFMFGYSVLRNMPLMPALKDVTKSYDATLLIVTSDKDSYFRFLDISKKYEIPMILRHEAPKLSQLYDYLHASDVLVKHVDDSYEPLNSVRVSSTVHLCLGSGCPIVVSNARIFDTFNKEVIKYHINDLDDFKSRIVDVLEGKEVVKSSLVAAEEYIRANSSHEVAKKFVDLFQSLLLRREKHVRASLGPSLNYTEH